MRDDRTRPEVFAVQAITRVGAGQARLVNRLRSASLLPEDIDIGGIVGQRISETKTPLGRDAPSRARQRVRSGDTLISTVRTYLKKAALVPPDLDHAIASTGFCVLRPGPAVEPRFLFHRVLEDRFVDRLCSLQTGSSYPAVRDRDVFASSIALPPLAEQRRIVAAIEEQFSRLDAANASLARASAKLDSARATTFALLAGADWAWTTLGEIAEIVGGVTKDSKRQGNPGLVEVPYLRVVNVQRGYLDLGEIARIRVTPDKARALALRPGDVLFNEGGDRDKLGRGWVWNGEIADCIHQNHVFRARLRGGFEPRFVACHGNTFGRSWFEKNGRQTTNLASINLRTLKSFPVPASPLEEQRRIVADVGRQLSIVDATHAAIDRALERSKQLRRSILERAFTGKLVPQDPDDEPASALLDRIRAEQAARPHQRRPSRRRARMASNG